MCHRRAGCPHPATPGLTLIFFMKKAPHWGAFSLSIKSIFRECSVSRGSAHEIDFAKQNHKNREHVSRFLYSKREKVSAWELSDVRVLRSQNTDCRKNVSFSTVSRLPIGEPLLYLLHYFFMYVTCETVVSAGTRSVIVIAFSVSPRSCTGWVLLPEASSATAVSPTAASTDALLWTVRS